MLKVVDQALGEVVRSSLDSTVSETETQSLLETMSVARSLPTQYCPIRDLLSRSWKKVHMLEDKADDEHSLFEMKAALTTSTGSNLFMKHQLLPQPGHWRYRSGLTHTKILVVAVVTVIACPAAMTAAIRYQKVSILYPAPSLRVWQTFPVQDQLQGPIKRNVLPQKSLFVEKVANRRWAGRGILPYCPRLPHLWLVRQLSIFLWRLGKQDCTTSKVAWGTIDIANVWSIGLNQCRQLFVSLLGGMSGQWNLKRRVNGTSISSWRTLLEPLPTHAHVCPVRFKVVKKVIWQGAVKLGTTFLEHTQTKTSTLRLT